MTESPETPGAPPPAEPSEAGQIAQTPPPPPPPPPTAEGAGDYPVHLDIDRQEEYSRFMPLIKWLILLPHYLVLILLGIGAFFAVLISFFAVLFTRRYPRGLFDFVVMKPAYALPRACHRMVIRTILNIPSGNFFVNRITKNAKNTRISARYSRMLAMIRYGIARIQANSGRQRSTPSAGYSMLNVT